MAKGLAEDRVAAGRAAVRDRAGIRLMSRAGWTGREADADRRVAQWQARAVVDGG